MKENKAIFDYCNIPKWWDKGFTGKGVKIGILVDDYKADTPVFDGWAHGVDVFGTGVSGTLHGFQVTHVLHQVCPEAELYYLPFAHDSDPLQEYGKVIEWCVRNGINIISMSNYGSDKAWFNEASKRAVDNGIVLVCAGGNHGDGVNTLSGASKTTDNWISIGAYDLIGGKPVRAVYSSVGNELDFSGFTNIAVGTNPESVLFFSGTSCSCPFVVGMLALWFQYFKGVYWRYPRKDEVYQYMMDNCVDVDVNGFDKYGGWGLFRLPVNNGVEISMKVGSVVYNVNGQRKLMDTVPRLMGDRVMVPVRFVSEALGCKVAWDDKNQVVTITKE